MALPDFAFCGDPNVSIGDSSTATLNATIECQLVHAGVSVNKLVNFSFAASGGIAGYETALINAVVAAFAAQFSSAVLARTSVVLGSLKLGS